MYQESELTPDWASPAFYEKVRISNDPFGFKHSTQLFILPDLPPQVFNDIERFVLLAECGKELEEHMIPKDGNLFMTIEEIIEFCKLLQKPENHILVGDGQYRERAVNTRTVIDMTHEMEQELISLPRFTAYAKVIEEQQGQQLTTRYKIKTFPLPPVVNSAEVEQQAQAITRRLTCTPRVEIEQEIQARRTKWQRTTRSSHQPESEEPPPFTEG